MILAVLWLKDEQFLSEGFYFLETCRQENQQEFREREVCRAMCVKRRKEKV